MKRNIPVHYLNFHGRFLGSATPVFTYHGLLRKAQWEAHFDELKSLNIAKKIVCSKISNMRTIMMRFLRENRNESDRTDFENMKAFSKNAEKSDSAKTLRGYEGVASKTYFKRFADFIKPEKQDAFPFTDRNRRPPKDPVNALLGFGYSLLAKDCFGTAARVGYDPFCGFYHTMKYGRPSLALDVMEFFRQPVVDSIVLTAINNGIIKEKDFYTFGNVCYLNEKGRKKFLVQYEMRKKDLVTHPRFHYRLSYARTIELQYRFLGKYLLKEVDEYAGFVIK
jgi:CRISPR-associated protein Cas1